MAVKDRNYLSEPIIWRRSVDAEYPYESVCEGRRLTLRVNDFPEEHLYTLLVDKDESISFDDWPASWVLRKRDEYSHEEDSLKPSLPKTIFDNLTKPSLPKTIFDNLTKEERQLLLCVLNETSMEEIARSLDKDVTLVRYEWNKLLRRLLARARNLDKVKMLRK